MNSQKAFLVGAGFVAGLVVGLVVPTFFSGGGDRVAPPPAPLDVSRANLDETIARLQVLLKNDPGNYEALVQLGNAYFDSDRPAKAVEAYNRALEINPSSPDVRTDLGVMYRKLGRFDEAVKQFRAAMDLSPDHVQSRQNLGVVLLYDLKDYKGAVAAWEELLRVIPPDSQLASQIQEQLAGLRQMLSQVEKGAPAPGQPAQEGLPPLPPGLPGSAFPPGGGSPQ